MVAHSDNPLSQLVTTTAIIAKFHQTGKLSLSPSLTPCTAFSRGSDDISPSSQIYNKSAPGRHKGN